MTRVLYKTFGCKANQYDTERMRQELESRGAPACTRAEAADVCVVNTCTVTNRADADARRFIRRICRERPGIRVVVVGCSAALRAGDYRRMPGVEAVVPGHEPVAVAVAALPRAAPVRLEDRRPLDRLHLEPVGGELLGRRLGATRGWLKIQDGCDRKCSFCATRLARGASRSRPVDDLVAEARGLARFHPELVLTGIHIGHYGRDLPDPSTLSMLLARLLDEVPDVRLRLGSVEATEIDDLTVELLETSGGRVAPHLHVPLQSGADAVLRRMRRWHTREAYRRRVLEIAERLAPRPLGLGADVIVGFPGERDEDHEDTRSLVEELPFTYLHVFPFSPRDGTVAAGLPDPVPQRVAGERGRDLREVAHAKGRDYRSRRIGQRSTVVLEGRGRALTGDYLRVRARGGPREGMDRLFPAALRGDADDPYIDLSWTDALD